MGHTTTVFFIAVEKKDINLPIKDWIKDVGNLLEKAYDNVPESGLIHLVCFFRQFYFGRSIENIAIAFKDPKIIASMSEVNIGLTEVKLV